MQENPEQIQLHTKDESAETPNWVADAGSQTWQATNLNSVVRAANVVDGTEGPNRTAELRDAQAFGGDPAQINPNWREHRFYSGITQQAPVGNLYDGSVQTVPVGNFSGESTPTFPTSRFNVYRGGKPYEQQGNQDVQPVAPIGIPFPEGTPLDRQVMPGLPPPEDSPTKPEPRPNAPEPNAGVLITKDNKVLIPTFDLSDPVLDSKNRPKVQAYDINSPEAKLYLENRDSIVKITTNKMGADGKIGNAWASGFFVNENGQIATADHVVDGAMAIKVTTAAGKTYDARVVQRHTASESAVIELTNAAPGEKFRPIPLRDSASDLTRGEKLTVLGHPNGVDEIVMSKGAFASRERFAGTPFSWRGVNPNSMFIHATTRIQGGNSGGPLLDSQGRAVGLTNFRHDDNSGEFIGIDDVRSMITDSQKGQLSDQRSYVFPSSLQFDKDVFHRGLGTLLTAGSGLNAYVGRNATSLARFNGSVRSLSAGMAAGYALRDMPGDYMDFKSAWNNGSTAEKVNTGIDLGGDVLMAAGSLTAIFSRRYGAVASAVATVGAGSKLGNAILGDRRYH
ncbi:MAG: hypothetical protein C0469_06520 [Cyanobacteria bacterium DS2.3.42]|nr:hypothetical protein [Cyanobacteria bacterium DS2.3.42]